MEFVRRFYYHYRRTLSALVLAVTALAGACLIIALVIVLVQKSGQDSAAADISGVSKPVSHSTAADASTSAQQAVAIPDCVPVTAGTPGAIPLGAAPAGLSEQSDSPARYSVYGSTASQLRAQLQQCGPGASGDVAAEFTGRSDYNLDWQYNLVSSNGQCVVTNVKVGLHTSMILPNWLPTAGAASGLASRWQAFSNGLLLHEQGHVAIDRTYAVKLVADLNALGTMPCDQASSAVHAVTSAGITALNQANDAYDTRTNHGATQGAVLPTY